VRSRSPHGTGDIVEERKEHARAEARSLIDRFRRDGATALDEAGARELLTLYGIEVAPHRFVRSRPELHRAADTLGFPLALKGVSPGVLHKTEAGLVHLNLQSPEELDRAYAALTTTLGNTAPAALLERMVPGRREFVAGMFRDPQFGPVVMFGLGGILTEVLADTAFAVAPLTPPEAEGLLDSLRSRELLGPFRGLPPGDRAGLVDLLLAVSRLALDHEEISEIDLNPLILPDTTGAQGDQLDAPVRPLAVDALIALAPTTSKDAVHPRVGRISGGSTPTGGSQPGYLSAANWRALFHPRSIIVAGASSNAAKWGGSLLVNLVSEGFPGTIYPINARGGGLLGLPAYTDISEVPGNADLALAAVPAAQLPAAIRACAAKGVKALVAVTAGFGEHSEEGAQLEREVARVATEEGVLLLGPNTVGLVNTAERLIGLGAVALDIMPGSAGLFSQSGNVAIALMLHALEAGLGIGKFVGVGNEALVTATELLDYFAHDTDTSLVLAYMEGVRDGRSFMAAASRATARKPVVILRGGTSETGGRAAASHTGALAGSHEVFRAAARQSGLIVTTDQNDLIDTALALSRTPLPPGDRVAVMSSGGGWGVLCADELNRQGLRTALLSPSLVADLDRILPQLWSRRNPLDLVATIELDAVSYTLEQLLADEAIDAVIMLGVLSMPFMLARVCAKAGMMTGVAQEAVQGHGHAYRSFKHQEQGLADIAGVLMDRFHKPVLAVEFGGTAQPGEKPAGGHVLAVFPSPLRACRALVHMWHRSLYLRRLNGEL